MLCFFQKVKGLKKIMIGCYFAFTIGLRSIKLKANTIYPIMHFSVQICSNIIHRLMFSLCETKIHSYLFQPLINMLQTIVKLFCGKQPLCFNHLLKFETN